MACGRAGMHGRALTVPACPEPVARACACRLAVTGRTSTALARPSPGAGTPIGAGVGEHARAARASGVRTLAISAVASGPSRAHGRAAARSVAFSTAACASRPALVSVAVRADPAAFGQPGQRVVPRLVGPAPHRLQVLPPQVQAAPQDHGLAAVDVRRRQRREMPVAPVLAQHGGRLPEPAGRRPVLGTGSAAFAAASTRPEKSSSPIARQSRSAAAAASASRPASRLRGLRSRPPAGSAAPPPA